MTLPEITEPVDLCDARGELNPRAVGWTRHPLHRPNLRGWGRTDDGEQVRLDGLTGWAEEVHNRW